MRREGRHGSLREKEPRLQLLGWFSALRARRATAVLGALLLVTLMAVGVAQAATYGLSGRVPRFGSQTYDNNPMYTTAEFNDINFKYSTNPYYSSVKPVKCSNLANISDYKQFSANNHIEKVIASNVLDGTCFYINIDSGTDNYWDFVARVRA